MATGARIVIDYADSIAEARPTADAEVEHTVLIVRLSEPLEADVAGLADQLGELAARARLDSDGSTLRVALNRPADAHVSSSYDLVAIDLVPLGAPAPAPVVSPREAREAREREEARLAAERAANAPEPLVDPLPVQYRVGQATEYTRIEFLWPQEVGYSLEQTGNTARIRFDMPADVSLGRLRGSPPRFLDNISAERDVNSWVLTLEVTDGVEVRAWNDGSRVVIDLPDPDIAGAAALLAQLDAAASGAVGPEAGAAPGLGFPRTRKVPDTQKMLPTRKPSRRRARSACGLPRRPVPPEVKPHTMNRRRKTTRRLCRQRPGPPMARPVPTRCLRTVPFVRTLPNSMATCASNSTGPHRWVPPCSGAAKPYGSCSTPARISICANWRWPIVAMSATSRPFAARTGAPHGSGCLSPRRPRPGLRAIAGRCCSPSGSTRRLVRSMCAVTPAGPGRAASCWTLPSPARSAGSTTPWSAIGSV